MKASEIKKAFGHKLIGSRFMKKMVTETLRRMPEEIIDKVTKNCWFISSFEDGWAFSLRHDDLKRGECLIFLSDELLRQDEHQVIWTITHEIGHVILGHRNSIGRIQTKAEVRKQEKKADEFARRYLSG